MPEESQAPGAMGADPGHEVGGTAHVRQSRSPEAAEAVEVALGSAEMVVADASDAHEVMVAMDAHDSAALVERLTSQVQESALGKAWVYEITKGGKVTRGLTVDAVQDITQQMAWTGKCAVGIADLTVETIEADEGHGPEPFWVATAMAVDSRTGVRQAGSSMEPQWMRLSDSVANRYRKDGKMIRDDNKVFDRFSREKAINKAQRNAMEKFIPEIVKLTLIAMAAKNPSLVERIRTEQEAKIAELPPPLDTPEAKALIGELEGLYDQIKELGGGQGRIKFPPGQFASWMLQSQHDLGALERFKAHLEERLERMPAELESERLARS